MNAFLWLCQRPRLLLWLVLGLGLLALPFLLLPANSVLGLLLLGAAGFILLLGCFFSFPKALAQGSLVGGTEDALRTTLIEAVGGLVLLAGALVTWQQLQHQLQQTSDQLRISADTQRTEQLNGAMDQLGSDQAQIKLAALFTLERIGRTAPDPIDRLRAFQVLTEHIRARSPWPPRPLSNEEQRAGIGRYPPLEIGSLSKRAVDVQQALSLVGSPNKPIDLRLPRLRLADVDLRGAILGGLDLARVDLRGTALDYADARVAPDRTPTNLRDADLRAASLRCAHLQGVDLRDANLQAADLRDADLRGIGAQRDAKLDRAALDGAMYNDWTQWPTGFQPPDSMRMDDTILAVHGNDVVLVKGGILVEDLYSSQVVRDGMAIERNGRSLEHAERIAEAYVLGCEGQQIGSRLYRPGMTKCPPVTDQECRVGRRQEPPGTP